MYSRLLPLSALMFLTTCGRTPKIVQPEPVAVQVFEVTADSPSRSSGATFPAVIAYDRETTISPRVDGVIVSMPAIIGQRLGRGTLIAAIADTPYRATYERAEAEWARLARASARNRELLAAGAIAPADVQDNTSALVAARAAKVAAAYDLASTRLLMPFDGLVLSKTAELGAMVGPGQAIVTIADLKSPLIARAQVPPTVAARLQPGKAAQVMVAGSDVPIGARVLRKGAIASARDGTVEIDLIFDTHQGLVTGTIASVRLTGLESASDANVQRIPAEALVDSVRGKGHVYVVDSRNSSARLTAITILGMGDDDVRISGLAAGTQIITAGAGFVSNGQRVLVMEQ